MPRTFDGVDDRVNVGLGAMNSFTFGPGTIAAIVKSTSDTSSGAAIHVGASSTSTSRYNIQVAASILKGRTRNTLALAPLITITVANGWCLIAMTKATGTVVPRFHKVIISTGAATHENSVTSLANPDVIAVAPLIGATEGFFTGDILVGAIWDRVLSDAEIELLASSLWRWTTSSPRAHWRLDQELTTQKVRDLSGGNSNESSLVGTAVSNSSVPIMGYGSSDLGYIKSSKGFILPPPKIVSQAVQRSTVM